MLNIKAKTLHRRITLISLVPLLITSLSGSLYSLFQYFGFDLFWLIKIHTGNFVFINLQPIYSPLIGLFTIFGIISGIFLYPKSKKYT